MGQENNNVNLSVYTGIFKPLIFSISFIFFVLVVISLIFYFSDDNPNNLNVANADEVPVASTGPDELAIPFCKAIVTGSSVSCSSFEDPVDMETCTFFTQIIEAKKANSIEICNNHFKEPFLYSMKVSCRSFIEGGTSVCDEAPNEEDKQTCLVYLGFYRGEMTAEEFFVKTGIQTAGDQATLFFAALAKRDMAACDSIKETENPSRHYTHSVCMAMYGQDECFL